MELELIPSCRKAEKGEEWSPSPSCLCMSKDSSTGLCHWVKPGEFWGIPRPAPREEWGSSFSRGSIPWGGTLERQGMHVTQHLLIIFWISWSLSMPLHRQSISGNTRCFNAEFPLGSIFFPKAQPPLHSTDWASHCNQTSSLISTQRVYKINIQVSLLAGTNQ